MSLLPAILVSVAGAAVVWALLQMTAELRAARVERRLSRTLAILSVFAPGMAAASEDPKALLSWQPIARSGRALFPDEFADLDRAAGGGFPFSAAQIEQAHARWTADWLTWEQAHDNIYKRKTAQAVATMAGSAASAADRAELDSIEREKLERYQARYGEYVKVAKGLQALMLPTK